MSIVFRSSHFWLSELSGPFTSISLFASLIFWRLMFFSLARSDHLVIHACKRANRKLWDFYYHIEKITKFIVIFTLCTAEWSQLDSLYFILGQFYLKTAASRLLRFDIEHFRIERRINRTKRFSLSSIFCVSDSRKLTSFWVCYVKFRHLIAIINCSIPLFFSRSKWV